jgi:hypothetical protein
MSGGQQSEQPPGWYPDPRRRFAQRYHDGTAWTEHVRDARDIPSVDPMPTTVPVEPGVSPMAPEAPVGPPPPDYGYRSGPPVAPGWDGPLLPPAPDGTAMTLGILGAAATVVGGLLVLLSLYVLDFLDISAMNQTFGVDLADVADTPSGADLPLVLDTYATFGRYLAVLLIVAAVLVPLLGLTSAAGGQQTLLVLAIMVSVAGGAFFFWHLLAALSDVGEPVGPAAGAWMGLAGYLGVAGGPPLALVLTSRRHLSADALSSFGR